MLDEYILSKLDELTAERKQLENSINANINSQNEYNEQINSLMEKEDVGLELFSPRAAVNSTRQKVDEIKVMIDELQLAEAKLRDQIENNHQNELKLKKMLDEAHSKEGQMQDTKTIQDSSEVKDPVSYVSNTIRKLPVGENELALLLDRVENSMKLLDIDPTQARIELQNVCYYIKALITRTE